MSIFCVECNRKDFDFEFSIVKVLPFVSPRKDEIETIYYEDCNSFGEHWDFYEVWVIEDTFKEAFDKGYDLIMEFINNGSKSD